MNSWRLVPFPDAIADESAGSVKTPQSEFLSEGHFPVVDQGKELISGYVNDESRLCHAKLPVIVFGDHTRCFKYVDFPFCMGADGVKVLRPKLEADTRYLYHYLRQLKLTDGGYDRHFKYLKRCDLMIPPLAEQRRIAAILDKAEELRAKRRIALAELDALAHAIFLDMFGDPATNPKLWAKIALGDVATFVGGGTPSRARPEYFTGSICWATSKDMKCEFLDDTEEHVTEQAIQNSATKLVPIGTILVVVKSKILAHHLPVVITRVPACFGQDLKGIIPGGDFEVPFIATSLRLGKRSLLEKARGINTEGLTLDHLRTFPIQAAPSFLQREFTRRFVAVEKLKAAYRASLGQMDALFASLQHRAFQGEL